MELPKILIGTSGWGYDEWVGPFYPKGLDPKEYLHYYSEIFYTNEINTTFYNIPARHVVQSWVKKTPSNFLFTAKLPEIVTHKHKLAIDDAWTPLMNFLEAMEPMTQAKKLLAFLIQLPPSFRKDRHFINLKEFIANWPEDLAHTDYHLVVEFRHISWMVEEVFDYLKEQQLTYCSVIEPDLPPRLDITNPNFSYIRFHGYGEKIWFDYEFKDEEIKEWACKIQEIQKDATRIGIYFNNHFSGYAAKNALMMMKELGGAPRKEPKAVQLLDIQKQSGKVSKSQMSLDKFIK